MLIFSRYTWWVAAMIGLALFLTAASQVGLLNPFQGAFLTVTSPVERVFGGVFRPMAGLLSNAGDIGDVRDENKRLRLENETLQIQLVEARQDAARVKELEQALKLTEANKDEVKLAANVVHRDSSPFTDVVLIDRGSGSGIKVGMVVLSSQGTLMGTVTKVTARQSFVRLVTDSKSRVAAETEGSKASGIVKGTAGRSLAFDLAQADIKAGDIVVTSALTGRYPAGITIGRVTEVKGTAQDLFRTVKLESTVRLSTATTVLVLTSFTPTDVAGGSP
jgi:rod shape-determining protein MreC